MISDSGFSYTSEIAGPCSVSKSMLKIINPFIARGMPNAKLKNTGTSCGVRCASVYMILLLKLSNTLRPSSTAASIEAKLSSNKTISAASRATSEDEGEPMAMPMCAALSAGESLTPSPVTATISPSLRRFSTNLSFI